MATINNLVLRFDPFQPRAGHVRAQVTGQVIFSTEDQRANTQFRLSLELRASDAGELPLNWEWPAYPLHTFTFLQGFLPFSYAVIQAGPDPYEINVTNDISLEDLDEDPGADRRVRASILGPRFSELVTRQDEVYALAILASTPGQTATSAPQVVPGSEMVVPGSRRSEEF
ncbi:MAG: hypothetical protein MRJ96_15860 [Nitrospirales bacterium]|nr:hypothetical protein [Nitrospira sp.]MDR4502920.1 hypothetical protein [Nitrospirales bacterium]